jgi:perosamine synthetase
VLSLAKDYSLRVIEDAAHCCPAYYREDAMAPWKSVGSESAVACYSFYANKCITTGEGGMACTDDDMLAERMRIMALHGISKDAWKRFTAQGSWYYEIIAPGYKYNLTDIASSIGMHQLRRANLFRDQRSAVADSYRKLLEGSPLIRLPAAKPNRVHSWHLFAVRLVLDQLRIDRASVMEQLKAVGVGASVHWIPLHMHPYYRETYGYRRADLPVAWRISQENISLPLYPGMTEAETSYVAESLLRILRDNCR